MPIRAKLHWQLSPGFKFSENLSGSGHAFVVGKFSDRMSILISRQDMP